MKRASGTDARSAPTSALRFEISEIGTISVAVRAQHRASEAQPVEGELKRAWLTATVPLALGDL